MARALLTRSDMKYSLSSLFAVVLVSAAVVATSDDAHACSTVPDGPRQEQAVLDGEAPLDGPIGFSPGSLFGFFEFEVTDEDGVAVPVTDRPSPDPKIRWIRPVSGRFPEGRLTVVVRGGGKVVLRDGVKATGTIADYRLRIDEPKVDPRVAPDGSSPKIRCERSNDPAASGSSCGSEGDALLASRWDKIPLMTVHDHDLGWVKTLFTATHRWTVRHADGTIDEELGGDFGTHFFKTVGVEYCVESTRTPRPGIDGTVQTERLCVQDDGARFAWSDEENEAQLVASSKASACVALHFPDGVEVPEELEDEADAAGGCAVGARPRGGWSSALLVFFGIAVATRRRFQRG